MIHRTEKLVSFSIIIGCLLFVAWLAHYGPSHRAYLERQRVLVLGHSFDAYAVWKTSEIRGRELYLFDSRLNAKKTEDIAITPESYIYTAAMGNILRKVHLVLPEAIWPKASVVLGAKDSVAKRDNAYRFTLDSTPVLVTSILNVALPKEKALVIINTDVWSDRELGEIIDLLKSGRLKFDILAISGEKAEEVLNSAGMVYERQ